MQNKPNLRKTKMNITHYTKMDYKENCDSEGQKNKPKQTQTNPISAMEKPETSGVLKKFLRYDINITISFI